MSGIQQKTLTLQWLSIEQSTLLFILQTQQKTTHNHPNPDIFHKPSHVPITNIPTSSGVHCADIAIHPNNPDKIMVVFSNYSTYSLFYSDDAGSSWNKVAGNLEENQSGSGSGPSCRTAQIIDFGNSTLYIVGTSVGLFATDKLVFDISRALIPPE